MASKEELVKRAEELGLTVTRTDGGDGDLRAEDYHAAIAEAELNLPAALQDDGEARTFEVGGPYKVFGKRRGQTIDAKVVIGDDGSELVVFEGEWAVLKPLLDSGFLKPA